MWMTFTRIQEECEGGEGNDANQWLLDYSINFLCNKINFNVILYYYVSAYLN